MSSVYDIKRWDSKINNLYPNRGETIPVIYIQPDKPLMKFIQEQNFTIPIKILNTHTGYDLTITYAKVMNSRDVIGYRPNFQEQTNWISLLLDIDWQGYPNTLGKVSVYFDKSTYADTDEQSECCINPDDLTCRDCGHCKYHCNGKCKKENSGGGGNNLLFLFLLIIVTLLIYRIMTNL